MELEGGSEKQTRVHQAKFIWLLPAVVSLSILLLASSILFSVTQTCQIECLEGRDQLS